MQELDRKITIAEENRRKDREYFKELMKHPLFSGLLDKDGSTRQT